MGYWKQLAKRAAVQAAKDAKLDSAVSAVIAVAAQAIIAALLWVWLGAFTDADAATRLLAALTPFLTYPVAFIIRLILAPSLRDEEVERRYSAEIAALKSEHSSEVAGLQAAITALSTEPPKPAGYSSTIYQDGRPVGNVSSVLRSGNVLKFGTIVNTGNLDRNRAFLFEGQILVLKHIESSIGMLVSDRGAPLNNVLSGVECWILGDVETVRLPRKRT